MICNRCSEELTIDDFYGYNRVCKTCIKTERKDRYIKKMKSINPDYVKVVYISHPVIDDHKVCKICLNNLHISKFTLNPSKKSYAASCNECGKLHLTRLYFAKHKEELHAKKVAKRATVEEKHKQKLYNRKKTESGERKQWHKCQREDLKDGYIKKKLVRNTNLSHKDIPQHLIELKRTQLKLKRKIKENG